MRTPTTSPPRPADPGAPVSSLRAAAAPLLCGALVAWLELAGGLYLHPTDSFARTEALFFFIWRPWVLILAAVGAGHWTARRRAGLYAATLVVAAAGETIFLLRLGAADPWPEMLRGLAFGIAAAAVADLVVQALRRRYEWLGSLAALILLGGLLFAISGTRPYEALVIGPTAPRETGTAKPPLLLMTSLPIIWGEGGAFDPNSRPAESYRALEREFQVTPIDSIEPGTLGGHRLMLLAQPRRLAPEELVALDQWVREGGRILILTDPVLAAAREFPLMDVRRPPEVGLLAPLLAHWGVRVGPGSRLHGLHYFTIGGWERRLVVDHPGRLSLTGSSCRDWGRLLVVRCSIGRGQAIVVADADLLTDATWAPAGPPRGHERHLRIADNPIIVAHWLDSLAGITRERSDRPVSWLVAEHSRTRAFFYALAPGFAAILTGLALLCLPGLARPGRGPSLPTNLSTAPPTENNSRTD
jgi:hypothetical protein